MKDKIELKTMEKEVLKHIAEGMNDREIAKAINRSYGTVRLYVMGLFKTFRTSKRAEMVYLACKEGYLN